MKATKNWCYGAKAPDLEEAVNNAIYAAHRYRNKLCELEHAKRERHEALLKRLVPEYVIACNKDSDAEEELGKVRKEIQSERVKQRTKVPKGIDAVVNRAKALKVELKELRASRKAAKKAAYESPDVIAAIHENQSQHKAEQAQAKQESNLYWGTEAIVRTACSPFSSGPPPRFARYDGTGQLAVQLQGGLDTAHASRSNTLCYIGDPIGKKRRECFIRIASDGRRPVFAKVQIVMHRELPKGAIKWAYLEKRKIADHERWTIRFTIDVEVDTNRDRESWCAVHVGWAMQPNGLRAASWQGSDGKRGAVVLSPQHIADYDRLDVIRSTRDKGYNEAKETLKEWCVGHGKPDWMRDKLLHIYKCRTPRRLAALVLHWRDNRFEGDETIFPHLDDWRKEDKHRWQNERRLAVRIVRRRTDLYRNIAKRLSDSYGVLYVGKIDAKDLTENSEPEDLSSDNTQSHRHAKWAAVSDLIRMLGEKFPLHAINVDTKNLTRQCANCGEINTQRPSKRRIQCHGCGKTWDIDENAMSNTIARGEAAQTSGALLELQQTQRDKEAKAVEKLKKMQSANRAARKVKREASKAGGRRTATQCRNDCD